MRKLSLVLAAVLLVAVYTAYRHPHLIRAQAQNAHAACCGGNAQTGAQVGPREIDFPYYSLKDGFSSKLLLVSDSPHPIDLNVAVRGMLGETVLVPMSIQPQEKLTIDVRQLLAKQGADVTGAFAEGSIAVYFIGTIMPVVGQLTMTNPAMHLIHESEMVENDPGRTDIPAVLSGLWWNISGGRDAKIMVSNTNGNTVTASVFLDFLGKRHPVAPLIFSPHETKTLSITQLLGSLGAGPADAPQGGITIIQHEPHPSLIAQGKVLDPVTGFSTTLEFPDPARQPSSALHASGLPIGTPSKDSPYAGTGDFTPHVIARNLTGTPETLTITVEYPKGSAWNSVEGPGGSAIPRGKAVLFSTNSATANLAPKPADLTGQLALISLPMGPYAAVDYSLDAVLSELPLPLPFCSVRIQYSGAPGSVIAQVSSVDERQDLVVDARAANEGDAWTGSGANPWHLDQQTQSFLFLTDESDKPARIGFVVTANGVRYDLMGLLLAAHETRLIDLRNLRDAQIPDPDGHRIPASASDGSINWIRLDNVPVAGRLVVIRRRGGVASNYDCTPCSCPDIFISLSVSPSSATILANATTNFGDTAVYEDCNGTLYRYPETPGSGWTSGNPSVATVSGGTVTGQGGGTATIYATYGDCSKWTYDYFTDSCNCSLEASDTASATVNDRWPTSLKLLGTISQAPISSCTVTINGVNYPGAGWTRQVTWQVLDQNGQPIQMAGMQPSDSLVNAGGTNSCGFPLTGGKTGTGNTDANGQFPDTYSICSTACPNGGNCQSTENQSWRVSGEALGSDVKKVVYTCKGITINGQ